MRNKGPVGLMSPDASMITERMWEQEPFLKWFIFCHSSQTGHVCVTTTQRGDMGWREHYRVIAKDSDTFIFLSGLVFFFLNS